MDQTLSLLSLKRLWLFNLALCFVYIAGTVGVPYLKSSVLEYPNVKSDPFNGTTAPIKYVPNWLDVKYSDKSIRFESIPNGDFIDLPFYDPNIFEDDTAKDKIALLERYTYITPYMGSYRMNFKEYDGSHLAVDIRAPLGTPVLSVANGVVVKVNDSEGGDGKYVVIRHDGVSFGGAPAQSYYSSYLHLESISAVEGTKVSRGQVIGKVGMTGITTTPHLHFQVDRADAPFHPYWPYTFNDTRTLGLDFFDAVNVGLGKENAMKYTVHPLDFVQNLTNAKASDATAVAEVKVASSVSPPTQQNVVAAVVVAPKPQVSVPANVPVPLNSAPVLPDTPVASPIVSRPSVPSGQAFKDIARTSAYFDATKYLKDNGISQGFEDATFRPNDKMTRRDAIIFLSKAFSVEPQLGIASPYPDVDANDPVVGYLGALKAKGMLQSGFVFRPNDTITKSEFVSLVLRLSGTQVSPVARLSMEIASLNAFSRKTGYRITRFQGANVLTRGEVARMIYLWKIKA